MKRKIFTLLVSALFCSAVMAQAPTAEIKRTKVLPVIDGLVDSIWIDAEVHNLVNPFNGETPTLGDEGSTTWQALWSDDGIYILMHVNDDVFAPLYASSAPNSTWLYDKIEIYFNANYDKKDGGGSGGGKGHYGLQTTPLKDKSGIPVNFDLGSVYCYKINDPSYVFETYIPFAKLLDKAGNALDKSGEIGFDIYIVDNDALPAAVRNRVVWSNVGNVTENYSNMNDAGIITLAGVDDLVSVDKITLEDASLTGKDTIQMKAVIEPSNASIKQLSWKITNGTGKASIDLQGRIVGVKNGEVTLQAVATDGSYTESNVVTITISGQIANKEMLSYIKGGSFDVDGSLPSPWIGSNLTTILSGVAECYPSVIGASWDYKLAQKLSIPIDLKDLNYVLSFTASSDVSRIITLDFEDENRPYNRFGSSSDPEANVSDNFTSPGESCWSLQLTTVPTEYNLHVTFNELTTETVQVFNFFMAQELGTVYIDNVSLLSEDDLAFLEGTSAKSINANSMKVYPNPVGVGNVLSVEVATAKTVVSIYNTAGQKLMEKIATGNVAKFNVSNLNKGMYIVKLSDGSTSKFIK